MDDNHVYAGNWRAVIRIGGGYDLAWAGHALVINYNWG